MTRLRYNNALGTLGASLTSGGTTITFAAAPSFATIVAPDYIPLVIDPPTASPNASFEVVYLTAYTAAATTGTISRGQEGSTAGAHANGANWVCAPTVQDIAKLPSRANRQTTLALTASAYNKIPFDTITMDPAGNMDVVTNHRYNVPAAGNYLVSTQVQVNGASGDSLIVLYKNGTEVSVGTRRNSTQAADSFTLVDIISCSAGDYLETYMYVTSAGISLQTGGSFWINYMAVVPL